MTNQTLAIAGSVVGIVIGLSTIATLIYTAGQTNARASAQFRRLCEHIVVLEQIQAAEHPAYSASIYVNKGCDE